MRDKKVSKQVFNIMFFARAFIHAKPERWDRCNALTWKGRVEKLAIFLEHAVLDGQGDLVGMRGQVEVVWVFARVAAWITNKIKARHTSVHVQASDAQGVVVIPEGSGFEVVQVRESGGPVLGSHDGSVMIVEELGIAIVFSIGVTAVEMRHNRHAIVFDRCATGRLERVGPVQSLIHHWNVTKWGSASQSVISWINHIIPSDFISHSSFHFKGLARPGVHAILTITVDLRRRFNFVLATCEIKAWFVLVAHGDIDFDPVSAIEVELEVRVQSVFNIVRKEGARCRVALLGFRRALLRHGAAEKDGAEDRPKELHVA